MLRRQVARPRSHRRAWLLVGPVLIYAAIAAWLAADGLEDRPGVADIAIVPGSSLRTNGRPSPRLAARLDAALDRYRAGAAAIVFVSGGREAGRGNEAVAMRDYVRARGVPAAAIVVDSLGIDSWSTARAASRYMRRHGLRRAVVATQFYHVPRMRLALERHGIATVYSRHARYFSWRDAYSLAREVPAIVQYHVRPSDPEPAIARRSRVCSEDAVALATIRRRGIRLPQ
jgi:uncharacterized SAM-binding protein YcdF (DUF218 family)